MGYPWYVILASLAALIGGLQLVAVLTEELAEWRLRRERQRRAAIAPTQPPVPVQPWPFWVPPGNRKRQRQPSYSPYPRGTPPRGTSVSVPGKGRR